MVSLSALSTDMMLPGIATMSEDLGAVNRNAPQLIISALLLGLTFGQLFYGPLSDSFGRRPLVFLGFSIFLLGTLICIFAPSFKVLLIGRLLQGFGAAGPRVVGTSIVRDLYSGRHMARILSFMMSFFIIVPTIAPFMGQYILTIAGWREIFYVLLGSATTGFIWFGIRQGETLHPEYKRVFSPKTILGGFIEVAKNKICLLSTLMAGFMIGAFYSFLMSSPQIFKDLYGITDNFPNYFAILAICAGGLTFVNAKLVMTLGIRTVCKFALILKLTASSILLICLFTFPSLPFAIFMIWACIIFAVQGGVLFGNFNAMAMDPVGHLAGIAAAFVATLSTGLGVLIGTIIGQIYNGTLVPLVTSFIIAAAFSLILLSYSTPKNTTPSGMAMFGHHLNHQAHPHHTQDSGHTNDKSFGD